MDPTELSSAACLMKYSALFRGLQLSIMRYQKTKFSEKIFGQRFTVPIKRGQFFVAALRAKIEYNNMD
jgi:hypothetical protein